MTDAQAVRKDHPCEETFHKICAPGSADVHNYKVTHFVDDDGHRIGKGFVEVEEDVVHGDDTIETKFRRTGVAYAAFMGQLKAQEEARVSQADQAEAMQLLQEKRALEAHQPHEHE